MNRRTATGDGYARAALLIFYDFLEPRFAHLNLGAQFLDLRRLLFHRRGESGDFLLQVVHGTVLLEEVLQ